MTADKKLKKFILISSVVLFLLSLTQKCYCTSSTCGDSIMVLLLGWAAVLSGGAGLTWIANPLLFGAWLTVRKNLKASMLLSVFAALVSLSFLLFDTILDNEGGQHKQIIAYKSGYWLWVASSLSMLAGTLVLKLRQNTIHMQTANNTPDPPYKETATNLVYNLLFCDSLDLYKTNTQGPYSYPFDILFSETSGPDELQRIIDDGSADPRVKVLAYNRLLAGGHRPGRKEILAVIVEVSLDEGLDVLASFSNGTARYINQSGKILVWETTTDVKANGLTRDLFSESEQIITKIGPWDQPRKQFPAKGNTRITFLVSDGLYFGEAATNILFSDPLAGPALAKATELMQYLTETSLKANQ